MALFEDLLKGETALGVAVGVTTVALASVVIPTLAGVGRPLARTALKTGIVFYEKTRETVAEVGDVFGDLVAEAKAELALEEASRNQEAVEASKEATEKTEATEKAETDEKAKKASPKK